MEVTENFTSDYLKKHHGKSNLLIQTFDDEVYLGFIYNNNGNYIPISLPGFTLVYFDYAYKLNIQRKEIRQTLLSKLSNQNTISDERSVRTEIYNREQIQQNISFFEKLKKVLPQLYNKNFFSKQSKATAHIENLKDLRDKLVHTKSDMTFETHIETFRKLLNFNYDETFHAVTQLFNFYKKDYVEPSKSNFMSLKILHLAICIIQFSK